MIGMSRGDEEIIDDALDVLVWQRKQIAKLLEVLDECAEHLDKYADFESDGYGGMEPNKAARLLYDVQCAINEAEGGGATLPRKVKKP